MKKRDKAKPQRLKQPHSAKPAIHQPIPAATQPLPTDQLRTLLQEICALANSGIQFARPRHPASEHDEEDREHRMLLLRQTLERVGWVADVALRRLGDAGSFESAEDWMLPQL